MVIIFLLKFLLFVGIKFFFIKLTRCTGSDGSMSASGSAGPGFNLRQDRKFSFENFQPWS